MRFLKLSDFEICYVKEIFRVDTGSYGVIDFRGFYAGFVRGEFRFETTENSNKVSDFCQVEIDDDPEIITKEEFFKMLDQIHERLKKELFSFSGRASEI